MELDPVGAQTERYYGNVDVPDGGYIGNEDGLPLIIFDYGNEALQLGGTNILGAGNITATGLDIAGIGTFDNVVIDGTEAILLDMSGGTPGTAIQKWPAGTILSTGDIVFQPTVDSTTAYQWLDANGDVPVLNINTTSRRLGVRNASPNEAVDIIGYAMVLGADDGNEALRTDETAKHSIIAGKHYRTTEESIQFFICNAGASKNVIFIGGSSVGGFNAATEIRFHTAVNNTTTRGTERMRISNIGNINVGEVNAPETLLELFYAQPYITLHNSTHEDTDGGRESRLIFKGEQSGGEETELAVVEISHDGTGDDQLGKWALGVNTGAGVVDALEIDSSLNVTANKSRLTAIGGIAVKFTNKTGGNTVAGQLVEASAGTTDAFSTSQANSDETIGVVLDAGVADGSEAWVVISGIADVLIDAGGSTFGDRMITSATAGSADVWNTGGAVATHFQEIGHCIESRGGAGLARCILHFN